MSGPCGHFDFGEDTPWIGKLGFGIPALRYAELGFSVLPLERGGKKPHRMLPMNPGDGVNGVKHATRDGQQIQEWWRGDPAANIGVATGQTSHLVVIDLDCKSGINGIESFHQFLSYYSLPWPLAPIALTPSGGQHYWLHWPDNGLQVPGQRRDILPGVDVKGADGYVVAAPSMLLLTPVSRPGEHTGPGQYPVPYTWRGCPCSLPDAPEWVDPWLRNAPTVRGERDPESPVEVHLDIERLMREGVPAGERNIIFHRVACSMYMKYGTDQAGSSLVRGALGAMWQVTDHAGFSWREVLVIMESARRWANAQRTTNEELAARYGHYLQGWSRSR